MKIIEAAQGSQQWLQIRAQHFTASEAPAMLGLSKYKTRQELLREKATGLTEEVDANKQRLFDAGHAAEAAARPLAEAYLQEDLFPATGAAEIDGLPLLASFDGLNMEETLVWENKLASASVIAMLESGAIGDTYWPQLEQQLMVSGASRALFTACDGEKIVAQLWYQPRPERRQQIIAGWHQFKADMDAYQHVEAAPEVVAAPVADLPVLFVQARGEVTETNMPKFKADVAAFLSGLNMLPKSDQELVDGKAIAEKLRLGAKALQVKKAEMLAQTASIGEVASECDLISKQMNAAALSLEKAYDAEHENRKHRLIQKGKDALAAHIATLGQRIDTALMPLSTADFAKAIKGKSKIESMENGIATELARATIEANAAADKIDANLKAIDGAGYAFLFADRSRLVAKAPDDLALVIKSRIQDHQIAEEKRLAAEREKIRAEEEAKAAAKAKAEQDEAERQRKASEEAAAKIERDRLTDANQTRYEESAAQPTVSTVTQAIPPASAVVAAHTVITGSARLLDRLDDLARQMTERELSDLCIHAAHILESRRAAA